MDFDALAPRSFFFKGAPALILVDTAPAHGHSWLWWIGVVVGIWFIVSILFGIWWATGGAEKVFGPRPKDED
jgi:hypothetical protein